MCSDDAVDLYTCGRVGVEFVRSFCMKEPCALMMVLMHMHVEERALKSINNCQTFFEKTKKDPMCSDDALDAYPCGREGIEFVRSFCVMTVACQCFLLKQIIFHGPSSSC
jgi:hypothetical protein